MWKKTIGVDLVNSAESAIAPRKQLARCDPEKASCTEAFFLSGRGLLATFAQRSCFFDAFRRLPLRWLAGRLNGRCGSTVVGP
jgi:hypothetical protein